MSAVGFFMTTGEVSLTGASAKTVIAVTAAANHRALIKVIGVFFKGVTVSNEPVTVDLIRCTNAGTGTAGTPVKLHPDDPETLATDFVYNNTVEPTGITVLKTWYIHPQSGYEVVLPFDGPYPLPGGDFMGIRCLADDDVTVGVNIEGEE